MTKAYITSTGQVPLSRTSFDNTECGLDGDPSTGQEAIDALCGQLSVSASPGFTYGRSGPVGVGTYMLADGVSSNRAGRLVSFTSPKLMKVEVAGPVVDTYELEVFEHDGNLTNEVTLLTVVVTAASSGSVDVDTAITSGKRLGVRCSSGSTSDINVGLFLSGSF